MFAHTDDPILCILVDLETKKATVNVSGPPKGPLKQHYLFGIHAMGGGASTFGCLRDRRLRDASKALLQEVMPSDDDELSQYNKLLNYHTWETRYPVIQ